MSDPSRQASGPTIDEVVVADEPGSWERAGFSVDDDGSCRVGSVRIRLVGRERGKRILDWSLRDADRAGILDDGIDGLATRVSLEPPCAPAAHPNGVYALDHIVLITPNQQRTVAALEGAGMVARRTRETDTYGAPFLQTFFRAAEVIVELIGPEEPSDDGPARFFGLAYSVDDLDAAKASLGDGLGEPKAAVQPGRRIATLRHKTFDISVATAFMTPGPNALEARLDG